MTSKRSEILVELDENIWNIKKLISEQKFKVSDAEKLLERYQNIYQRMSELVASRDLWRNKYQNEINKKSKEKD